MVCASVSVTLVGMIYPDDGSGVRRALDFCLSLCLLVVVVTPMGSMFRNLSNNIGDDVFNTVIPKVEMPADEAISAALAVEAQRSIEERLEYLICECFELDAEKVAVSVSVGVTESEVVIDSVSVWLSGTALATDPREIKAMLSEYTDAECEIIGGKP